MAGLTTHLDDLLQGQRELFSVAGLTFKHCKKELDLYTIFLLRVTLKASENCKTIEEVQVEVGHIFMWGFVLSGVYWLAD